jgi:hypothetical protein
MNTSVASCLIKATTVEAAETYLNSVWTVLEIEVGVDLSGFEDGIYLIIETLCTFLTMNTL